LPCLCLEVHKHLNRLTIRYNSKAELAVRNLAARNVKGLTDEIVSLTIGKVLPQIAVARSSNRSATTCGIYITPFI
jgi:hypothetical protein